MQPEERDLAYLWDMRQAVQLVLEFTEEVTYHRFSTDKILHSAVERQLEILGEAASHISSELRQANPEIPWRQILGLRNILIHEYGEVKLDRVWVVATVNIPELLKRLDDLLPPQEE